MAATWLHGGVKPEARYSSLGEELSQQKMQRHEDRLKETPTALPDRQATASGEMRDKGPTLSLTQVDGSSI